MDSTGHYSDNSECNPFSKVNVPDQSYRDSNPRPHPMSTVYAVGPSRSSTIPIKVALIIKTVLRTVNLYVTHKHREIQPKAFNLTSHIFFSWELKNNNYKFPRQLIYTETNTLSSSTKVYFETKALTNCDCQNVNGQIGRFKVAFFCGSQCEINVKNRVFRSIE